MLLAKVIEDLAIGATGVTDWGFANASATAPPVFFIIIEEDPPTLHAVLITICGRTKCHNLSINPFAGKHLLPDRCCFIITRNTMGFITNKAAHINLMRVEPHNICQKMKEPFDLLALKVFAHTPVAKHFKKGRMAVIAYILDILRPQAGLAIYQAGTMGVILA